MFRTIKFTHRLSHLAKLHTEFAFDYIHLLPLYLLLIISKLDLCEGGSFSTTILKSDIKLSVYHISCFISVCPSVALSKAKFAENVYIVLSSPYNKVFIFTSCVFWFATYLFIWFSYRQRKTSTAKSDFFCDLCEFSKVLRVTIFVVVGDFIKSAQNAGSRGSTGSWISRLERDNKWWPGSSV